MNTPTSIKGFNVPAPSFPYIEGLPLYPFANALWNALEERATLVGETPTWGSKPYPATGRGFCPVESHVHDHYLILQRFDGQLASVCDEYTNQFETISASQRTTWTFNALLAKTQELLGISSAEVFPSMSSNSNGRSIAAWGIQRAVMVSLLTTIRMGDHGSYSITHMVGSSDDFQGEDAPYLAYQDAISKATQKTYNNRSYIGGLERGAGDHVIWTESGSLSPKYSADVTEMTQMAFTPLHQNNLILNGDFTLYLRVNGYGEFYAYGSPFLLGDNILSVTMENGIFYQKTFPTQPLRIPGANGWQTNTRQGHLFGEYSKVFQYGMTWNES